MVTRILPPPAQVPLAHGDARGGIFDAPWLPPGFIGPGYAPLPIDASTPQPIPPSTAGRPMPFVSTLPAFGQALFETVGLPPRRIMPYQPIQRRFRGGIFRGVGQVDEMATARAEWTQWRALAALGCGR